MAAESERQNLESLLALNQASHSNLGSGLTAEQSRANIQRNTVLLYEEGRSTEISFGKYRLCLLNGETASK